MPLTEQHWKQKQIAVLTTPPPTTMDQDNVTMVSDLILMTVASYVTDYGHYVSIVNPVWLNNNQ